MFSRQRGAALLILALIIGFVTAALLFNRFSVRNLELAREARTTAALAEAKAALLGFAVSFEAGNTGRYAFLPCTETDLTFKNEGSPRGNCGETHVNSIGRLPWRGLKSPPLRDGEKECLWYAVSGSYKNSGSSAPKMLNADSPGQFEIVTQDGTLLAGSTPENRAVAVIFSPGGVTGTQNRAPLQGTDSCPGNYSAANYLETLNGMNNASVNPNPDRIDRFILANQTGTFNDKLIFITRDEVFSKLIRHGDFQNKMNMLTEKIAKCIASYGNTSGLPWAAPLALSDYRVNINYESDARSPSGLTRGRVPYRQVSLAGAREIRTVSTVIISRDCGNLSDGDIALWENWKDHFFYARTANVPCVGLGCFTVNGGSDYYVAIVFFAGISLGESQPRRAPPFDTDTKRNVANYLEGRNRSNLDGSGLNFESGSSATFNDTLYCISASFSATAC